MRKANYQNGIASGIAGWQYTGDELGTFDGSFYGNYTSYYITGLLLKHLSLCNGSCSRASRSGAPEKVNSASITTSTSF